MTGYALITLAVTGLITPFVMVLTVAESFFDRTGESSHRVARLWARLLVKASFVHIEVMGAENLEPGKPYVFAANHTSTFDILVLMAALPVQFRWLAKEELFRIPVFGPVMARVGHIPVNRSNPRESVRSLVRAASRIRKGVSVVIFPEGTRSDGRCILPFKRGGFKLAVKAGVPIVPLSISGAARVMPSKTLKLKPGRIRIVLGRPVPTNDLDRSGEEQLAETVRQAVAAGFDPDYGRTGTAKTHEHA